MNLVTPLKPWPQLDGEPISLHDLVQRGMSDWNKRTGGWPTDLILAEAAHALLIADANDPAAAVYFGGSEDGMPRYCGLSVSFGSGGVRLTRALPDAEQPTRVGKFVLPTETTGSIPVMNAIMDGMKQLGGQQSADGGAFQFYGIHPDFDEIAWSGDKHGPEVPSYAATIGTGISGITVRWRRIVPDAVNPNN